MWTILTVLVDQIFLHKALELALAKSGCILTLLYLY